MFCIFKNLPDYGQVKVPLHAELLWYWVLTRLDDCYCTFYQKNGNVPEVIFCHVQLALRVSFKVYTQHKASF